MWLPFTYTSHHLVLAVARKPLDFISTYYIITCSLITDICFLRLPNGSQLASCQVWRLFWETKWCSDDQIKLAETRQSGLFGRTSPVLQTLSYDEFSAALFTASLPYNPSFHVASFCTGLPNSL